jgi:hypothetical protein
LRNVGLTLLNLLKRKLTNNDRNLSGQDLAKILQRTPAEIANWKKGNLSIKTVGNIITKFILAKSIDGKLVKHEILKKLRKEKGNELVSELGFSSTYIYKLMSEKLTAKQLANLIHKSRAKYSKDSIKPIIEFYRINKKKNRKNWELFSTKTNREISIKERLKNEIGIYVFYDSQGKALYVGKSDANLWDEIKSAFNRYRLKQTLFTVKHPQRDQKINWDAEPKRQIKLSNFFLHEIAEYFSAYKIGKEIVPVVEAAFIRLLPNDLYNKKIEKI